MLGRKLFRTVRPYLSALAVVVVAGLLVFTIYFTRLSLQWTAFLTGILVAAILAEATRVSKAEWIVMRRTAQLSSLKDRLERETTLRKNAEKKVAAGKPRLQLLDEAMLTMVVLVDPDSRCRYHNRAFREWQHLRPEQIDAHHLSEIIGAISYEEIKPMLQQSLLGKSVRYERKQTMPDGAVYHLSCEHVPQLGEDGKTTGVFILADDVTALRDVAPRASKPSGRATASPTPSGEAPDNGTSQELFIDSLYEQIGGEGNAEAEENRIASAIRNGEFHLLYQLISPLVTPTEEARHYEILIRLMEEEESMMPPGAFFPLAEKYGMMPYLDRWVVKHALELASGSESSSYLDIGSMLFINLARDTVKDPAFPPYVQQTLQDSGMPAAILCFEIPYAELAQSGDHIATFIQSIRSIGCCVALSGFGQHSVSFDLIRGFRIEFLKIDGSVILNVHRDPVEQAKVAAICRVAKKIGVRTIAEFVENDETVDLLQNAGVDFVQGFGIARPRQLELQPVS